MIKTKKVPEGYKVFFPVALSEYESLKIPGIDLPIKIDSVVAVITVATKENAMTVVKRLKELLQ